MKEKTKEIIGYIFVGIATISLIVLLLKIFNIIN